MSRAAIALLLTACSNGAVLELTLTLPSRSIPGVFCETCLPLYAVIDARSGVEPSFEDPGDTVQFVLTDETISESMSIVAGDDDIEQPLELRIRFCDAGICVPDQPELRAGFERAFYAGRSTFYMLYVSYIPTASARLVDVDQCAVEGCTGAAGGTYCTEDGRHLCE